jgi:1,4-alpha-glucan branching enzyme
MKVGAFMFVLHSHLPYCRNAGRWPHGEEWIHEAASETYIPLLDALYDLKEEGCPFKLTLGITPVLVDQLADRLVIEHMAEFMEDKVRRAQSDVRRFEKSGEGHLLYLAKFYLDRYQQVLTSFNERFERNLVGAFKKLQDEEYVELATSAATHAYLPLLERDSSIYGQLQTGKSNYKQHFGKEPSSVWLPECGYRPAYYTGGPGKSYVKPGLESFLAAIGLNCFFAETHTVEGGEPVGKAREEVIGPYGSISRLYVVPSTEHSQQTQRTTYLPYWVQTPEVAVIGRNNRTSMQVWSAEWGYPGDFNYREFHKKDGISGLQYWKVTGAKVDLGYKEYYDPYWADKRVAEHSAHYAGLIQDSLTGFYQETGKFGIISAAYDTELFGHWWFEGVDWLKKVMRNVSQSEFVEPTTASKFIKEHPPEDVLALYEGSWGLGGGHFTWQNADTNWVWPIIQAASIRMEGLAARYSSGAEPAMKKILNQAARELVLLQSSDWPFLITTGQARVYAEKRFLDHVDRFQKLADIAEAGGVDKAAQDLYNELWELDKVFPKIDYRSFAEREGLSR